MTVTASDIGFFAAENAQDLDYGGGRMTGVVVQDGTTNNLLPNVSDADRAGGRVQMRKAYAATLSADATVLLGAQISMKEAPTDSGTDAVVFAYGDAKTLRATAAAAVATMPYAPGAHIGEASRLVGTSAWDQCECIGTAPVGTLCAITSPGSAGVVSALAVIAGSASSSGGYTLTFDREVLRGSFGFSVYAAQPSASAAKCSAAATTTATSGSDNVTVNRLEARVVPNVTPYPTTVDRLNPAGLKLTSGKVPIFRSGDSVVVRSGATQEVALISSVNYVDSKLTFAAPLANSYASGATVTALLDVGNMGAAALSSFSQQTWTRVFSDSIVGSPISATYDRSAGSIAVTNLGTESDRYAIVFTSTTAFKLISETLGQIATGSTTTDFSPTNPITGAPLFTITAAGWGSGWAIGNVLRFNTQGSRVPFWVLRCLSPSSPGGTDQAVVELRGSV